MRPQQENRRKRRDFENNKKSTWKNEYLDLAIMFFEAPNTKHPFFTHFKFQIKNQKRK